MEEDDFLLIREREGDCRYDFFHEFSIEGDPRCESFTRILHSDLLLDSYHLESEELSVPELSLCSLECLYRSREVYIANIRIFRTKSLFLLDLCGDIIRDIIEIWLHIGHLLADPCAGDIVHVRVYGHDLLSLTGKMLDLT